MTTDSYGQKMAVECQVSPITIDEIQSRNRDYESNDYNYMWILNTKNYLKYLYPENKEYGSVNWRTFKLKAVESELYEMDWLFYWIENKIIKLKLYSNNDFKTHFYLSERNNPWLESYIKGK
jgi:competence CoiA-like predicted nuclease